MASLCANGLASQFNFYQMRIDRKMRLRSPQRPLSAAAVSRQNLRMPSLS